jgi:F-type H+-transporting ATPase subunit a
LKIRSPKQAFDAVLGLFLGALDIIGEFAKVLSLSGRLFGNLFAGDVMVAVIISLASFTQFIVPIPFMFLSIFSGIVQAAVFTMLSILFIAGTSGGYLLEREKGRA